MAEFNQVEKETETAIKYDEDDAQQGIASPVDCWELVGSSPRSPPPETSCDVTGLEEAIASACNSGSLLHDNYFGCAHSKANDGILPISTAMDDKQNDDNGRSSGSSDALVSLASDTNAAGTCTIHSESMFYGNLMDDTELMGHDDDMHHDDQMHDNDPYREDLPYCSNLICYGDQVQHGGDVHKMHGDLMMYPNEFMEHADRWHLEDETHLEGMMHIDGDSARCINQSDHSCGIVESMAAANVHHDVCAFGLSSGSESPSRSPMSLHGTYGDNDMSMQQVFPEGSSSIVLVEETGREATSQVMPASESVDVQHGTIKRQGKGFEYVSWIWTQFIRWQTQLGHANTIWSVALAAAVMGILYLGRGWQRLQAQNQSLRSQLWAKEKRITQLMFQLMQTKDALVKVRRVPVICVKPSLQIPQDNR